MNKRLIELIETLKQEVSVEQIYFNINYVDDNNDDDISADRKILKESYILLFDKLSKINKIFADVAVKCDTLKKLKKFIIKKQLDNKINIDDISDTQTTEEFNLLQAQVIFEIYKK